MPERLLAIDVGTTSARAMVVSATGEVLAMGRRMIPSHFPGPGRVEQDGAEIWDATLGAVRDAMSDCSAADIAAVGLTTQRASTVVWDRATGDVAAPIVVWNDTGDAQRSAEIVAAGLPCWPQMPSAKLERLLASIPGGRRRLDAGQLLWGPIDAWLLYRLTGGAVHATDFAGAWFTGYLDYAQPDRWNDAMLAFQHLPMTAFPEILSSWGAIGLTDQAIFGAAIPITAVLADQQAGMVAHNALAAGTRKATFGTSAVVMASLGRRPPVTPPSMPVMALLRDADGPLFSTEGMVISAASFLDWLTGGLKLFVDTPALAIAARDIDEGETIIVPALFGLGTPHGCLSARAAIGGLSADTTPAAIAAAALTGIAARIREIDETMNTIPDLPVPEYLAVDGGLSADPGFLQRLADMIQRPVRRHAVSEATAYGAALAAGVGFGLIDETDLRQFVQFDLDLEPAISRDAADAKFARWSSLRTYAVQS